MKKFLSPLLLGGAALFALASCGGSSSSSSSSSSASSSESSSSSATSSYVKPAKKAKILLGLQQTGDANTLSVESILDAIKDDLNFEYDEVVLASRDDVKNLDTYNEKLGMGYNGIISMSDLGTNQAEELIENCESAGAYYVGYKVDMANALKSETVKNSANFLGGISDGELDWELRAEHLFDAVSKSTDRKIVLGSFSSQYFPQVTTALNRFKELVTEWNAKNPNDQFTYGSYADGSDTWTCKFSALADSEKVNLKSQGVQAMISMNSVAKYVLPNLDSSVHLYNVGYEPTYDDAFGTDKQLRCQGAAPADSILLPVMRIINAVNGASPISVDSKVAVGNYVYYTTADQLAKAKEKLINFNPDHSFSTALFTLDQAKALVGRPDSELLALTNTWTSDYVLSLLK